MTSELSLAIEPGLAAGLVGAGVGLVGASGLSVTPEISLAVEVRLTVGLVGASGLSVTPEISLAVEVGLTVGLVGAGRLSGIKGGKGDKGDRGASASKVCCCRCSSFSWTKIVAPPYSLDPIYNEVIGPLLKSSSVSCILSSVYLYWSSSLIISISI